MPLGTGDGSTIAARVVGRDPGTDLVVLRADASGLVPAPRASTAAPRVGEIVLSLSRPGRSARARLGIVSAASGEWRTPAGGPSSRSRAARRSQSPPRRSVHGSTT